GLRRSRERPPRIERCAGAWRCDATSIGSSSRALPRFRLEPLPYPERRAPHVRTSTAHSIRRLRAGGRFRASTPPKVTGRLARSHAPPPSPPRRGARRHDGVTPRSSCSEPTPAVFKTRTDVGELRKDRPRCRFAKSPFVRAYEGRQKPPTDPRRIS